MTIKIGKFNIGFPSGSRELVAPQGYYEKIYSNDLHCRTGTWRKWNKQGGKFLWYSTMLLADPPILDIGCGAGHLASMYKAFGREHEYAGGIDYSSSAIKLARQKHAPWANFAYGNAIGHSNLLERNHYKTAVFLEVLEHVYKDRELINSIPSGRGIVASIPNFGVDGHCRWFSNVEEIKNRYKDLIVFERFVTETGLQSNNSWFVFKGVKI